MKFWCASERPGVQVLTTHIKAGQAQWPPTIPVSVGGDKGAPGKWSGERSRKIPDINVGTVGATGHTFALTYVNRLIHSASHIPHTHTHPATHSTLHTRQHTSNNIVYTTYPKTYIQHHTLNITHSTLIPNLHSTPRTQQYTQQQILNTTYPTTHIQ